MKRILKGIEGKRTGRLKLGFHDVGEGEEEEEGGPRKKRKVDRDEDSLRQGRREEESHEGGVRDGVVVDEQDGEAVERVDPGTEREGDWQDAAEFALEQDDMEGEVDVMNEDRDPGVEEGHMANNREEEREMLEVEVEETGERMVPEKREKTGKEKDRHKKDKKARRKEEKAARAEDRQKKKNG